MQKTDVTYIDKVAREGFAIFEELLDGETVDSLIQELSSAKVNNRSSQRAGLTFGLRDLLNVVPATRVLANNESLRSILTPVIGRGGRVVRAIYFDKHRDANWKVTWHQDLTIAVRKRVDVAGFGPWSSKAGVIHVQPPVSILSNIVALRIHLDHTSETNGALRVIPGSHLHGRLDANQIQQWKHQNRPATCVMRRGGVMMMRPLLLHSSLPSLHPEHRRVVHLEYASIDLPNGLEWFD